MDSLEDLKTAAPSVFSPNEMLFGEKDRSYNRDVLISFERCGSVKNDRYFLYFRLVYKGGGMLTSMPLKF